MKDPETITVDDLMKLVDKLDRAVLEKISNIPSVSGFTQNKLHERLLYAPL